MRLLGGIELQVAERRRRDRAAAGLDAAGAGAGCQPARHERPRVAAAPAPAAGTGRRAPAFMCSADAMPEDLGARASGFQNYWTKPVEISKGRRGDRGTARIIAPPATDHALRRQTPASPHCRSHGGGARQPRHARCADAARAAPLPSPGIPRRPARGRDPRLLWWPILHGVILRVRPAKSARKYASIWMPGFAAAGVERNRPGCCRATSASAAMRCRCGTRCATTSLRWRACWMRSRPRARRASCCCRCTRSIRAPPPRAPGMRSAPGPARVRSLPELRFVSRYRRPGLHQGARPARCWRIGRRTAAASDWC